MQFPAEQGLRLAPLLKLGPPTFHFDFLVPLLGPPFRCLFWQIALRPYLARLHLPSPWTPLSLGQLEELQLLQLSYAPRLPPYSSPHSSPHFTSTLPLGMPLFR